jgi:hypothetical protein
MSSLISAAQEAVSIPLQYARAGSSLVHAAMAGATRCELLAHYPRHDVVDPQHRTRYYYHAHGSRRQPSTEHGHFHVFSHGAGAGDYVHLVGISLDAVGQPVRLFTTNRWVTGEVWRDAAEIQALLEPFHVHTQGRMAPVSRWITAMVRLYRPQIGQLLRRRDACMARRSAQGGMEALWEDRRLDVVSQCRISLVKRIQQLGR